MLSLVCPDWERRIAARESLIPAAALAINPREAKRAIGIFNRLHLADVPGTPPLSEAAGDWFREIVAAVLGSIDPETGARLIRELFALVPKKNSKTSYSAGLMLDALLMNERPRAEFLFIGPTQAVSELAFDQAVGMIENDPDGFLQKRMHIQAHLKTITNRRTKAELKIKTFDASVLTGVKPVGVLIDELHEIAKSSRAARIIGQIRGGILPNPEGFLIFITTQSDEEPAGAFKAELEMARAIRDGQAKGAMLPVLYEFPKHIATDKAAWQNPANWPMVLPNLGRPLTIERLIADFDTAKVKGEEEIRRWASQHLNIEIGQGLSAKGWPGALYWEANADPTLTLDELIRRSEVITIGIDGGGADDLLGLSVLGREPDEVEIDVEEEKTTTGPDGKEVVSKVKKKIRVKRWLHWGKGWARKSVLERRKSVVPQLLDFQKDGDLVVVGIAGEDTDQVADLVMKIWETGLLPEKQGIGVDTIGISDIADTLIERGLPVECITGIPQGYKLNNSILDAERRLEKGGLLHCDQSIMSWNLGNAKMERAGSAYTITKQNAGDTKIDLLMSLLDAVAAMRLQKTTTISVFDRMAGEKPDDEEEDAGAKERARDKEILADLSDTSRPEWIAARERENERLAALATEDD